MGTFLHGSGGPRQQWQSAPGATSQDLSKAAVLEHDPQKVDTGFCEKIMLKQKARAAF
jgi:hypothetical protein